jgi:hypothetical protein
MLMQSCKHGHDACSSRQRQRALPALRSTRSTIEHHRACGAPSKSLHAAGNNTAADVLYHSTLEPSCTCFPAGGLAASSSSHSAGTPAARTPCVPLYYYQRCTIQRPNTHTPAWLARLHWRSLQVLCSLIRMSFTVHLLLVLGLLRLLVEAVVDYEWIA